MVLCKAHTHTLLLLRVGRSAETSLPDLKMWYPAGECGRSLRNWKCTRSSAKPLTSPFSSLQTLASLCMRSVTGLLLATMTTTSSSKKSEPHIGTALIAIYLPMPKQRKSNYGENCMSAVLLYRNRRPINFVWSTALASGRICCTTHVSNHSCI